MSDARNSPPEPLPAKPEAGKLRVLLLAPAYDKHTPGESWSTYRWVRGISEHCHTTVLTQHRKGWDASRSPIAGEVINWDEPNLPGMTGRLAWELNPAYIFYYFRARRWLKRSLAKGERFDVIHQINPLALRYPCPAQGLNVRYVIGPLAGSLPTPPAFKATTNEKTWYRKFRSFDTFRLRRDPWLRRSYRGAAAMIGVAPYVEHLLAPCSPRKTVLMAETGVETVSETPKPALTRDRPLRLLFVGRLISTKGILEAIESVVQARARCSIEFNIVGVGDLEDACRKLIATLKLEDIVKLHGRLPREEVFAWYDRSDVFLFPSYREPSGNVVFEAMSRGLPVITSDVGGPGYVVTPQCGFRVSTATRERFVAGLAESVVHLANDDSLLPTLSRAALQRIKDLAYWPDKIKAVIALYRDLLLSKN